LQVVYLPSGTYTICKTINMRTDTILMGDATDPPVLKPAAGFDGDTLINGLESRLLRKYREQATNLKCPSI
jgi:hypothetical protein